MIKRRGGVQAKEKKKKKELPYTAWNWAIRRPRTWAYLKKDYLDKLDKHFVHDRTLMESLFCKHTWGIVCSVCDQGVQLTPSPPGALCLPCDRQRQIWSRGLYNSSCRLGRCIFSPSSLGQNTSWLDQTTKSYTRIQQTACIWGRLQAGMAEACEWPVQMRHRISIPP